MKAIKKVLLVLAKRKDAVQVAHALAFLVFALTLLVLATALAWVAVRAQV